ncbi:alkaline phosphatase D family protein [Bacillus licheniformis]|nr:alkaline phosphatase D family protein [Bacillus licheniformis]
MELLVQQVVLAQIDRDTGPGVEYSTDQWDGFPACRDRLFPHTRHTASKPVVLTGISTDMPPPT